MRVLVLGGTDFTGPYFVRALAGMGHEVTVFHRGLHNADLPPEVGVLHGDLADPPDELRTVETDLVIHMLALTEADALRFLDLFANRARRAIVISSCDVYRAFGRLHRHELGGPDPVPLGESAPLRESRYPYRQKTGLGVDTEYYDKILVEQVLLDQRTLPVTILRYPAVWGPHDPQRRFRAWLDQMAAGNEITIQEDYARWRWTHGYSEDVAQSVVLASTGEKGAGCIYNVGEARTPTVLERLEELARAAAWGGRINVVSAAELPEDRRMPFDFTHHVMTDTSRIRAELGYDEVVPADEAWRRTIEWERSQPPPTAQ